MTRLFICPLHPFICPPAPVHLPNCNRTSQDLNQCRLKTAADGAFAATRAAEIGRSSLDTSVALQREMRRSSLDTSIALRRAVACTANGSPSRRFLSGCHHHYSLPDECEGRSSPQQGCDPRLQLSPRAAMRPGPVRLTPNDGRTSAEPLDGEEFYPPPPFMSMSINSSGEVARHLPSPLHPLVSIQRQLVASALNVPPLHPPSRPLRILVAEDNKVNQKVVLKVRKRLAVDLNFSTKTLGIDALIPLLLSIQPHMLSRSIQDMRFSATRDIIHTHTPSESIHLAPPPQWPSLLQVLQQICPPGSHPADVVENGLQVLERLDRGCEYDLILMDIHMPEMDGLEATRRICERHPRPEDRPRIVALSADTLEDLHDK